MSKTVASTWATAHASQPGNLSIRDCNCHCSCLRRSCGECPFFDFPFRFCALARDPPQKQVRKPLFETPNREAFYATIPTCKRQRYRNSRNIRLLGDLIIATSKTTKRTRIQRRANPRPPHRLITRTGNTKTRKSASRSSPAIIKMRESASQVICPGLVARLHSDGSTVVPLMTARPLALLLLDYRWFCPLMEAADY